MFYRTALGRAFRATSDDQAVAQLMGLDNRHVFALAMALSLAIVAIAGVLLAVRANFDPAIGPARLIFGFEAVIIGGLGSLWGTLAGGIMLGVAQAIGAQLDPGWQLLAGHLAFLARAGGAARGPVPEGARMSACRVRLRRPRRAGSRHSRAGGGAGRCSRPRRGGAAATTCGCSPKSTPTSRWRACGTCSPAMPGLVSVGQQAYVGLGAYLLFALTILAGVPPLWAIPLAGLIAAVRVAAGRGADLPPARALFRHRHLGGRRGVPAARLAGLGARRRLRHQPAGRHRDLDRGDAAQMREFIDLLDRARA